MTEEIQDEVQQSPKSHEVQYSDVELCEICMVPKCYCQFFSLHPTEFTESDLGESNEKISDSPTDSGEISKPQKKGKTPDSIPPVLISVTSRNKRKHITVVTKLQAHGITPKDFARDLSKKYSTSASTKDSPDGSGPCVQLQGDLSAEI